MTYEPGLFWATFLVSMALGWLLGFACGAFASDNFKVVRIKKRKK